MEQKQIIPDQTTERTTTDVMKTQLEKVLSVKPEIKTVKLQWRKCQGCSCSFSTLERTVPGDSHINDGDKIYGLDSLEENDKFIK